MCSINANLWLSHQYSFPPAAKLLKHAVFVGRKSVAALNLESAIRSAPEPLASRLILDMKANSQNVQRTKQNHRYSSQHAFDSK